MGPFKHSRPVRDLPIAASSSVPRTDGRRTGTVSVSVISARPGQRVSGGRCNGPCRRRPGGRRGDSRQIQIRLVRGPGQRNGSRARSGLRPARLPGTCPAAATAVDEQAVDGIRDGIQRRAHDGQAAERFPPVFGVEEHLEHHAPPVRMPRPVADPVGQCRLDQGRVMLFLPPEGRNLTVQDLDRPPLGHNRDGTSAPANATPAGPAQAATRRDPSRPPSPNGQPGNVNPKSETQTLHADSCQIAESGVG